MDWRNRVWTKEDVLYYPKRKVNNRGSRYHHHIIGSFYSQKNKRTVEYESLSERLFYYYLELDTEVVRYYVQPVQVLIYEGKEEWFHVPDVLLFRQRCMPLLYQVKLEPEEEAKNDRVELCNRYCRTYAMQRDWEYHVVYPKSLPESLSRNLRFLKGFLKERKYYPQWNDRVIDRLQNIGKCTIEHLASTFEDSVDPLLIKPLLYHLVAKGTFITDVNEAITSQSVISLNARVASLVSKIDGGMLHGV